MLSNKMLFRIVAMTAFAGFLLGGSRPAAAEMPDFTEPLRQASDKGEITLVAARPDDVIRLNLDEAKSIQIAAQDKRKRAEGQQSLARTLVDAHKKDIDSLKARLKVAKDQKKEAVRLDMERQIKTSEAVLKLLERESEMRDIEKDVAEGEKEYANAMIRIFEKELELGQKELDHSILKADPSAGSQIDKLMKGAREIRDQERRVLEAVKEAMEKKEEVSKKAKELYEKRLQVFEARLSTE